MWLKKKNKDFFLKLKCFLKKYNCESSFFFDFIHIFFSIHFWACVDLLRCELLALTLSSHLKKNLLSPYALHHPLCSINNLTKKEKSSTIFFVFHTVEHTHLEEKEEKTTYQPASCVVLRTYYCCWVFLTFITFGIFLCLPPWYYFFVFHIQHCFFFFFEHTKTTIA